jgi:hypothetical protein
MRVSLQMLFDAARSLTPLRRVDESKPPIQKENLSEIKGFLPKDHHLCRQLIHMFSTTFSGLFHKLIQYLVVVKKKVERQQNFGKCGHGTGIRTGASSAPPAHALHHLR